MAVARAWRELPAARPLWRYLGALAGEPVLALLDSALPRAPLGRYSYLAFAPSGQFRAERNAATIAADPFATLGALLAERAIGDDSELPAFLSQAPLLSGAIGYFAYESAHYLERLSPRPSDPRVPDLYFLFVDDLLIHDAEHDRTHLVVTRRANTEPEARARAEHDAATQLARFRAETAPDPAVGGPLDLEFPIEATLDAKAYADQVAAIQAQIAAGDLFECCLTQPFRAPWPAGTSEHFYAELRHANPAPFAAYLRFPALEIFSSSPERFLRLDRARRAESRPIKGTRPRDPNPERDRALADELPRTEKDRAEHLMIVDLLRSDLGRVAETGSVTVPELLQVESYRTVHQLVSTIAARLAPGLGPIDLVRACFPGGSMTGAPKIEAIEQIQRFEPHPRGVYSGALGYFDDRGGLDLSIVIRTLVRAGEQCWFSAGGAVVSDSVPRAEYEECLSKAAAVETALRRFARASRGGPG